jgi:hypothetical protein
MAIPPLIPRPVPGIGGPGFQLTSALYCLKSSFGPQKTKFESSTCTVKKLSDNENIFTLKMPSFLWQGKIKCLLARHDIHLPQASVMLHL